MAMTLIVECGILRLQHTAGERAVTEKTEDQAQQPESAHDPIQGEHRQGRPGVKDDGDIVSTAGGELMSGLIADIADGDT
jgi:hypothetical protein